MCLIQGSTRVCAAELLQSIFLEAAVLARTSVLVYDLDSVAVVLCVRLIDEFPGH